MNRYGESLGFDVRQFSYRDPDFKTWIAAHGQWWPKCDTPTVWGRFAVQACCGRHVFAARDQKRRYFGETLVAETYEQQGYICWTLLRLFRKPGRKMHGTYGLQTRLVESLLKVSVGIVPQAEYIKRYARGLRVKNPDVVGFHFGLNRWLFAEVKRENDRLHPGQAKALRFLRELIPPERADVFLAEVRVRPRVTRADGTQNAG